MQLKRRPFCDLPKATQKKIRSLTFRKDSGFLDEKPHISNPFMFLLWEGDQLNGWAALFYQNLKESLSGELHFYIRYSERRKGLASLLMKAIVRQALNQKINELVVRPWNNTSLQFFKRVANLYKDQILFYSVWKGKYL